MNVITIFQYDKKWNELTELNYAVIGYVIPLSFVLVFNYRINLYAVKRQQKNLID